MLGWNKIQSLIFNSMQNVDYICYIYRNFVAIKIKIIAF